MQDKSIIQWGHSHDFGSDNHHRKNKVKMVFWLTTIVMVIEIVAGTLSGSMALLADGWHMGTHSAAFLITIFAYSYTQKNAHNRAFSFGTGKVNFLGGFASAVALAIVALMMAIESVQRLLDPQLIHFNEAIFVAIIGLTINIVSVFVLHDDHHHHDHHHNNDHRHEHDHDHNMKAAYFHVLADTLTSVLAILALLTGKYFGWIWMDAIMGIVGAAVISKWSYGLIKESSNVLLDKSVSMHFHEKIAQSIMQDGDAIIHDIHVWKISESHQAAIIALTTDRPHTVQHYKMLLQNEFPQLAHISIEITPLTR